MFLTGDKAKMKRRAAIYGYGNNYFTYLDEIERRYQIVTVIDNDPKKQSESVVPVTDIFKYDFDVVLITNTIYKEIVLDLEQRGITRDCIHILTRDASLCKRSICGSAYYGQHGEDLIIAAIFAKIGITTPSYIDLGANHPFVGSNTALLYLNGCRGVNIEANPRMIDFFESLRPEDINLNVGVADKPGKLSFYLVSDESGLNSFSKDDIEKAGAVAKETMELPVVTLDSIVDEYLGGVYPDFLDCDIEGLDYSVLESMSFEKSFPKVICVEVHSGGISAFDSMMIGKSYFLFCRMGENNIYVHNSYKRLLLHISE